MATRKTGKRGNNEGSVYKASDGRWRGALTLPDGRRKVVSGATRAEVDSKLTVAKVDRDKGLPSVGETETVAGYLIRWLTDAVRPATAEAYERVVRLHIVPELGRIRLARLQPADLLRLYRQLLDKGLSPRMAQLTHAVIHRALEQALRWGLVARNVGDIVDPPRVARYEARALTTEEAGKLLEAAAGERLSALYALAVTCGLREGELLGLRWADVELDRGVLAVRQQVSRIKGEWVFAEPKTAKGRRTVAIPAFVVRALREHRVQQAEERLRMGPAWEDLGLVFPNQVGRPLEKQNLLRRSFSPLLERAGLPHIRFHDLRHTAATLLLTQCVHPKVVQERLGHSTITVTMDTYSHVMPQLQADAARQLDGLLGKAAGALP